MNDKYTVTHYRYEIGAEDYGVHEHAQSKYEAWTIGKNFQANNPKLKVYIFDKMARKGNVNLWHYRDGFFFVAGWNEEVTK